MSENLKVLSVYDGFFSGGARIVHTDIIIGLNNTADQDHSVISIHDQVEREFTVQRIEDDNCYQQIIESGIEVSSLGRVQTPDEGNPEFTDEELEKAQNAVDSSDMVISLKEQPLGLVNRLDTSGKIVAACLHRSDPENQGDSLLELKKAIKLGKLATCICCADSSKEAYKRVNIPESHLRVIPNGINLKRFSYSNKKRSEMRTELGIKADVPVVLFAARYEQVKNIPLFLNAARIYLEDEQDAQVIICGAGMTTENTELMETLEYIFEQRGEYLKRLKLLGVRLDMDKLYAGSDIISSTSTSEGFGLTLAEGLASGAIPVSTNIGEAKRIIDDCGIITSNEPSEIAQSWQDAYSNKAKFLARILRSRHRFDRRRMIGAYANVMADLTGKASDTSLKEAA